MLLLQCKRSECKAANVLDKKVIFQNRKSQYWQEVCGDNKNQVYSACDLMTRAMQLLGIKNQQQIFAAAIVVL